MGDRRTLLNHKRWKKADAEAIAEIRRRLKDQLENRPQFPEVVGDGRILRFYQSRLRKIDAATKMMSDFLKWYDANDVAKVRQDIVYGGKNSPFKFPYGKKIIELAPQIVMTAKAVDVTGMPISYESFDFSPREVFKALNLEQFLQYLIYTLEWRAIILEEISYRKEQEYLDSLTNLDDCKEGWGEIVMFNVIRDLKGVGFSHLGSDGRALVGAALNIGLPNYPEYLGRSIMINVPMIFMGFWYFVQGFLDELILNKICLVGSNYHDTLHHEITEDNIPVCLGGKFAEYNEPYHFDISEQSGIWYPGAPKEMFPGASPADDDDDATTDVSTSVRVADEDDVMKPNDAHLKLKHRVRPVNLRIKTSNLSEIDGGVTSGETTAAGATSRPTPRQSVVKHASTNSTPNSSRSPTATPAKPRTTMLGTLFATITKELSGIVTAAMGNMVLTALVAAVLIAVAVMRLDLLLSVVAPGLGGSLLASIFYSLVIVAMKP